MFFFFFFNDTATTEIYTLSLHDALPISLQQRRGPGDGGPAGPRQRGGQDPPAGDRESTRLNSRHRQNSYAAFCLKKKKKETTRADLVGYHTRLGYEGCAF